MELAAGFDPCGNPLGQSSSPGSKRGSRIRRGPLVLFRKGTGNGRADGTVLLDEATVGSSRLTLDWTLALGGTRPLPV